MQLPFKRKFNIVMIYSASDSEQEVVGKHVLAPSVCHGT